MELHRKRAVSVDDRATRIFSLAELGIIQPVFAPSSYNGESMSGYVPQNTSKATG